MKTTKILISLILFLGLCLSMFSVNATPTVENVTTEPAQPIPLSTIKVTATITGENISNVTLRVSECDDSSCYVSHSVVMSLNEDLRYEAELTLKDDRGRTNHLQYEFVITDNDTQYNLNNEEWNVHLAIEDNDNADGVNSSENDTPGFELLAIFIAILVGVIFYKKKR